MRWEYCFFHKVCFVSLIHRSFLFLVFFSVHPLPLLPTFPLGFSMCFLLCVFQMVTCSNFLCTHLPCSYTCIISFKSSKAPCEVLLLLFSFTHKEADASELSSVVRAVSTPSHATNAMGTGWLPTAKVYICFFGPRRGQMCWGICPFPIPTHPLHGSLYPMTDGVGV